MSERYWARGKLGLDKFEEGGSVQVFYYSYSSVAEAEAPILWPPDVKSQLTGKD